MQPLILTWEFVNLCPTSIVCVFIELLLFKCLASVHRFHHLSRVRAGGKAEALIAFMI